MAQEKKCLTRRTSKCTNAVSHVLSLEASLVKPHYQNSSGLRQSKLDGKKQFLNKYFSQPHAFGVWYTDQNAFSKEAEPSITHGTVDREGRHGWFR